MLLCLLLSILSTTFTVSDKNTISISGDLPMGGDANYSRTTTNGKKGQMTKDNSTTLCLTNWAGCIIHSVSLSMHSNSSAGAGSLQMTIGNRTVWSISDSPFADVQWHGSYSSAWVSIDHTVEQTVGSGEDVQIHIAATQNSLYIASYTILYTAPDPQAYEVRLVSGVGHNPPSLFESSPRQGVILPALPDTAQWHFAGWSETEASEDAPCPALFAAGVRYFPNYHCTLYAVYQDGSATSEQVTQLQSGHYALLHNSPYWQGNALTGGVLSVVNEDNELLFHAIETVPIVLDTIAANTIVLRSAVTPDMVYQVDFLSDTTLTLLHESTKTGIGYKRDDLAKGTTVWKYRQLSDHSLMIYFDYQSKFCYLSVGYGKKAELDDRVAYLGQCNPSTPLVTNGICLFPIVETTYTTWPFGKFDSTHDVLVCPHSQDVVIPWGSSQLHIRNGKKFLHLLP